MRGLTTAWAWLTLIAKNHTGKTYQTTTREIDRDSGIPNLDDYDEPERKLIRRKKDFPNEVSIPNPAVVRSLNIKIRARNEQYTRHMAAKAKAGPKAKAKAKAKPSDA